ncbi:hypothetical protein E2C01_080404 [Portunus trituberculatus]|uniref:Secreted protein n=1 Tax=Portunus trituberculatus TaxID=210409 RepID=A0A5B7ITE3_PORTR|nr:hypothetical protein [Portunus trituberculatus]
MLVCPQIALSLLAGWGVGGDENLSKIRSSESKLDDYYSTHHVRYTSPVTMSPPTPFESTHPWVRLCLVVGCDVQSSSGEFNLCDGGFSCGGVTCCCCCCCCCVEASGLSGTRPRGTAQEQSWRGWWFV